MHSYSSSLFHCVFSAKERRNLIVSKIRERLWAFLGGTARELGMKVLIVGGIEDHVHLLLSLPATISVAEAIHKLKANSSRWVHQTFPARRLFGWQKGYGAFSIGVAQAETTIQYIKNQQEHHRKIDFRQELAAFLEKHGLAFQDDD
jgi:REP element-mobilizing transposase RayT